MWLTRGVRLRSTPKSADLRTFARILEGPLASKRSLHLLVITDVAAGLALAATPVPHAIAYAEFPDFAGWRGLTQHGMAVDISVEL